MSTADGAPALVRAILALEGAKALDPAVRTMEPKIRAAFGSGTPGRVLRGDWLGHALHPLLTDLVVGSWTSANVLDLFGGADSRSSAQRLVATGLLAAAPTAWTGWAEWSETGPRDKRVGLVHAAANGLAIGTWAASWVARRRGSHATGARLGLAGAALAGSAAYLGGHLASARKVSTHHPAFGTAGDQVPSTS